jgi:uncharacterized protein GlcG (DUF336 family)
MSRVLSSVWKYGVLAGAVALAAVGAKAQGLINNPKISAALANQLVGDSVAACATKGYKVVAVVVDLDGVRQAMLRGDGAPVHSIDNAYYKAYSAASITLGRNEGSTKEVPQTPLPNVTYGVGGVTIKANGAAIGGIGVSGAPGGNFDEECALSALAKVQDKLK